MSDRISLTAELREDVGKGASRRLRRLGNHVPAIIYGAEEAPQTLALAVNELDKVMQQEAFYSQILDVVIKGKKQQAVVRDLQRDPANSKVQHIDFFRISVDKEIQVSVPLHFINEDVCVGVKVGEGNITHNLTEVEISCLPAALPEYIEIDMEEVDVGSSVHLSELILPEGVVIVALTYGAERDIPVVSVTVPRGGGEEEEMEEEMEAAEGSEEESEAGDADSDGSEAGSDEGGSEDE
ncbi:MAG: 50S ribosomal protein L25/general stress protein Ctc [Pseudomonadota bacterium]|nr:50S ribosomal protein L25/general stress protein Ctc [Pseudomonadota bacterium]